MLENLSARKKLLIVVFAVVLLLGGCAAYYFVKGNPFSADTVSQVPNVNCAIKLTDKNTNKPIKQAAAFFASYPNTATSLSDSLGCIALPSNLKLSKGDFVEVMISAENYNSVISYLSLSSGIISGKAAKNETMTKVDSGNSSQTSQDNSLLGAEKAQAADSNSKHDGIEGERIDSNSNFNDQLKDIKNKVKQVNMHIEVTESANNDLLVPGFNILICRGKSKCEKKLVAGVSDNTGHIITQISYAEAISNDYVYIKATKEGYNDLILQDGVKTRLTDAMGVFWDETSKTLTLRSSLPVTKKVEEKKIGDFQVAPKTSNCPTVTFPVYWVSSKEEMDSKIWSDQALNDTLNSLAGVICSLQKSEPKLDFIPIPEIKILRYGYTNESAYDMSMSQASAYTQRGKGVINIAYNTLCGWSAKDSSSCKPDQLGSFVIPIHEYGHLLDLGNINKDNKDGNISGQKNWKNLFELVNTPDIKDSQIGSLLVPECKSAGENVMRFSDNNYHYRRCYFTTNILEFWAESFAFNMAQSLAKEYSLDINSLKEDMIPYNENWINSNAKALNTFKFWKKFMATTLGSYCHPNITDDNGSKTGITYAPPWDPVKIVIGGPLSGEYSPEAILAGTATNMQGDKGAFKVTFRKLPDNYTPTGLTLGIAPSCEVGTAGTANYRACGYGPFSISIKDTEPALKTGDVVMTMPLAGFTKYDVRAYYYCPDKGPQSATAKLIESGRVLNTKSNSYSIGASFADYPPCKTATPMMPGQNMPGAR